MDPAREASRSRHRLSLGVSLQWSKVQSFKRAWKTACSKAGISSRIPHDFRRTAVRNLTRAGIVERVAMEMTGHLTRSVFERYNIVSHGDVEHAKITLDSKMGQFSGTKRHRGLRFESLISLRR